MVCVAAQRAPAVLPERHADEPYFSYKFDRRQGPRHPASYSMPASYTDGRGRFGVTSVDVVDASSGGLGLLAACAIEPGMTLSLHAPGCRFPAVTATVVQCVASEDGYRLGLATHPKRAA